MVSFGLHKILQLGIELSSWRELRYIPTHFMRPKHGRGSTKNKRAFFKRVRRRRAKKGYA